MTTFELEIYVRTHFPKNEYNVVDIHSKMKYALAISLTKADIAPHTNPAWWIKDAWEMRDEAAEKTEHQYDPVPRNKTTRQLLKDQTIRGKITQARKELRARMPYVSFEEQRQIIFTFLAGTKTDRLFVLRYLDTHWDDCYKDEVERLWLQYHEMESARVVVHHFPQQFIREYAEPLSRDYLYLQVLLRLPATLDIDRSRLTDSSYLYYCARKGIMVDDSEATRLLYQIVADNFYWFQPRWTGHWYNPKDGLYSIPAVGSAIWSLGVMGKTNILLQFYDFELKARVLKEKNDHESFRKEIEQLHLSIDFSRLDKGPIGYYLHPQSDDNVENTVDANAEIDADIIDENDWSFQL